MHSISYFPYDHLMTLDTVWQPKERCIFYMNFVPSGLLVEQRFNHPKLVRLSVVFVDVSSTVYYQSFVVRSLRMEGPATRSLFLKLDLYPGPLFEHFGLKFLKLGVVKHWFFFASYACFPFETEHAPQGFFSGTSTFLTFLPGIDISLRVSIFDLKLGFTRSIWVCHQILIFFIVNWRGSGLQINLNVLLTTKHPLFEHQLVLWGLILSLKLFWARWNVRRRQG